MKRIERIVVAISVSLGVILGYVICQSVAQMLFFLLASLFRPGTQANLTQLYQQHMADVYLVAALVYAGLILAGLLLYKKIKRSSFPDFLKPPAFGSTWLYVLASFAAGMCVNLALSNVISLIPFPKQWLSQNAESVNAFSESNLIVMLIAQSIAAPLVEELIFRGVMYHALRRAPILTNRSLCIFVSATAVSAVFGWFHGNALQALYCFCFSLVLILIVEKTGSLWGGIIAHMGFNSPWVLMLFIYQFYNASSALLNGIVFSVLSVLFVLLTLWCGRAKRS